MFSKKKKRSQAPSWREALRRFNATIVDGPSALGVYTLRVADGGGAQNARALAKIFPALPPMMAVGQRIEPIAGMELGTFPRRIAIGIR